jgi:phosphoribosylformimino-5-aminoimidazole carboxamide ribonucleotide (ProFAR) isomerase
MVEAGCAGVDLLAYRATEADPLDMIRAARAATKKPVVVAGSVNSPQRIRDVAAAGADLFTIGTAALDGSFAPRFGSSTNCASS